MPQGKRLPNWPPVARIRDSYKSKEIDELFRIPGSKNIADALEKRNIFIHKTLGGILENRIYENSRLESLKSP